MERKAAKLFGLALIGVAAVALWRSCFGRSASPSTEEATEPVPPPSPPTLLPVPDPPAAAAPRWGDPVDGTCPEGYPVKVNERSGIYHVPGGLSYERTQATRCYADPAEAEADGFRRAKR